MFRKTFLFLLILLGSPFIILAHEGHGVLHGHEPGHYLFSPEHAIPMLLALALVVVLAAHKKWRAQKK